MINRLSRRRHWPIVKRYGCVRPDERLLLETTLSCLEQTAQHTGRKPLVILDEFHSVTQLDSFPRVKDTLSVVGKTLSQQTSVAYIAASSSIRKVEQIVQSGTSPLSDQFQVESTWR